MLIDWAETRGNKQDDERGVYILNVDENVEDAAFKAHFEKHGTIDKVTDAWHTLPFYSCFSDVGMRHARDRMMRLVAFWQA